jgi:hypothetical protein
MYSTAVQPFQKIFKRHSKDTVLYVFTVAIFSVVLLQSYFKKSSIDIQKIQYVLYDLLKRYDLHKILSAQKISYCAYVEYVT